MRYFTSKLHNIASVAAPAAALPREAISDLQPIVVRTCLLAARFTAAAQSTLDGLAIIFYLFKTALSISIHYITYNNIRTLRCHSPPSEAPKKA